MRPIEILGALVVVIMIIVFVWKLLLAPGSLGSEVEQTGRSLLQNISGGGLVLAPSLGYRRLRKLLRI